MNRDTIYAVATGRPPAAIAILRLSGPQALVIGQSLAGSLPPPGRAALRPLTDPADGTLLDRALVLTFHAPASATGEDVVELHLHGGRAVIAAVERAIGWHTDTRLAQPGEFTRRALMAGRIDLVEAEGLGDLLCAETEAQRRAALNAAEGAVSKAVNAWAARLTELAARLEATIDFADEDDVATDEAALSLILRDAEMLARKMSSILAQPPVERLRDGIGVVFAGPSNSGKSSLFNAMIDRDAAIVSPIAGTTRDRLEAPVSRNGVAYLLIDTAGLHDGRHDIVETIGIDRAKEAVATADLVLWLGDDQPQHEDGTILVHSRCDVPERGLPPGNRIAVSAVTGEGIAHLWKEVEGRARRLLPSCDRVSFNQRQHDVASGAMNALNRACRQNDPVLIAEHFRVAREELGKVTGITGVEAMLDALFSRFCIGK